MKLTLGQLGHDHPTAKFARGMIGRLGYFMRSSIELTSRAAADCPSCRAAATSVIARKWLVTSLRRCERCQLMFRAPVMPPERERTYYQEGYESGMTTRLPSDGDLQQLLATGFRYTEKNWSRIISILGALGIAPRGRVFDYGCSWGYGTWQLQQAGYRAAGYEISEPRAGYAAGKLAVSVRSHLPADVDSGFDAAISVHVLEHVPSVAFAIQEMVRLTAAAKGLLIAITPNGCADRRHRDPGRWRRAWGMKHPNLLDDVFWRRQLAGKTFLITTDLADLDALRSWATADSSWIGPLDGGELLVVCRAS